MARYGADQNKVLGLYESGLYAEATAETFWLGEVIDHSVDDAEGLIESRYMGTTSRSFSDFDQGPRDVTGTLSYHPVDMRLPFLALGSVVDVSGTNISSHIVTEFDSDKCQNFFVSGAGTDMTVPACFTIEDSKQAPGTGRNFIRTIAGNVIDTMKISASEGEKVTVDIDYIGQTCTPSSGASSSITDPDIAPYMWSDCMLTLAGSSMDTAKSFSLETNNNMQVNHYIGSSALGRFYGRVIAPPVVGNRNHTLSVTMDLPSDDAIWLYENKYKGNNSFNATLDMDADVTATGSKHATFNMSGCQI